MNLVDQIRQAFLRAARGAAKLDIDPQNSFLKGDLSGLSVPVTVKGSDVKADFEDTIPWPEKGLSRSPLTREAVSPPIDPLDPNLLAKMLKNMELPPMIFEDKQSWPDFKSGDLRPIKKIIIERPKLIEPGEATISDPLSSYAYPAIFEKSFKEAVEKPAEKPPVPSVAVPAHVVEGLPATTLSPKDWTNSAHRIEWSLDLPVPISHWMEAADVARAVDAELRKHGSSIQTVDRIHIAYPHKNPELYPGYSNSATNYASSLQTKMQAEDSPARHVIWGMANELVENRKLGRSEDQSSVHALTAKQEYAIHTGPGTETSPFALMTGDRKEFFIVLDTGSEQGTTYANLVSHVRSNGGIVVGIMGSNRLEQSDAHIDADMIKRADLPSKFMDPSRNTKRLPAMALAFAASARAEGRDWTPAQCLEKFEDALQKNGNSVFAMTDGEVKRVIKTVNGDYFVPETFPHMLGRLEEKAAAAKLAPAGGDKPKQFQLK